MEIDKLSSGSNIDWLFGQDAFGLTLTLFTNIAINKINQPQ